MNFEGRITRNIAKTVGQTGEQENSDSKNTTGNNETDIHTGEDFQAFVINSLQKLNSLPEEVRDLHNSIANLLHENVGLCESVEFSGTQVNELKTLLGECAKEVADLKSELQSEKNKIQHQDQRISVLEKKNIDLETYIRRHNIFVEGKHERENENCTIVVLYCVREEYGIPVTEDGIDKCHRFGRWTGGRPGPIIVRFLRHATRDQVLSAARSCYRMVLYTVVDQLGRG